MVELLVLRVSLKGSNPELEVSFWYFTETNSGYDELTNFQSVNYNQAATNNKHHIKYLDKTRK